MSQDRLAQRRLGDPSTFYLKEPTLVGDETNPSLIAQGRAAIDRILAAHDTDQLSAIKQLLIEDACLGLPDRAVLQLAALAEMKEGGHARAFLEHYINGGGAPLEVDMQRFLVDNPDVRTFVAYEVEEKLNAHPGERHFTVAVPNAFLRDRDWQFALGGFYMDVTLTPEREQATFTLRDRYAWHPHAHRLTQCVHQAAQRLKTQGAADFEVRGHAVVHYPTTGTSAWTWQRDRLGFVLALLQFGKIVKLGRL